jgi:hypothetical protein
MTNKITGAYSAIVDGESTALAGCADAKQCDRSHTCLRADERLNLRNGMMSPTGKSCLYFISNAEVTE